MKSEVKVDIQKYFMWLRTLLVLNVYCIVLVHTHLFSNHKAANSTGSYSSSVSLLDLLLWVVLLFKNFNFKDSGSKVSKNVKTGSFSTRLPHS